MARFPAFCMLLVAGTLVVCTPNSSPPPPVATFPSPTSTEYTVVTRLAMNGSRTQICVWTERWGEPLKCDGMELRGIDLRTLPGHHVQPGDLVYVNNVKVTGTWDGVAVTATRPARVVDPNSVLWRTDTCDQTGIGGAYPVQDRLNKDFQILKGRGIYLMSDLPCVDGVQAMVAIADPATVTYLTTTYGVRHVVGWFQPVTAQPASLGSRP
jgi:hypothetical protein